MKKSFFTIALATLFTCSFGQRLSQVTLNNKNNSTVISLLTEDAVFINVTTDGTVLDWGVADISGRINTYPPRLEKYMGRVEYYPANDNNADYRGKVKYVGRNAITYYSASENELFRGKIKSIGTTVFDYYNTYDDELLKGKLKNAGTVSLTYYSSFDNEAYKGKIKNIGTTTLTYYSSFDDKAYKGKLKSIDSHTFTYYSSFEKKEYNGIMKSGFSTNLILNGVKYFVNN